MYIKFTPKFLSITLALLLLPKLFTTVDLDHTLSFSYLVEDGYNCRSVVGNMSLNQAGT